MPPVKNRLDRGFFDKIFIEIDAFCNSFDECIVFGDFNFVEEKKLDRTTMTKFVETGNIEFQKIRAKLNINDAYRFIFPNGKDYSFYSGNYNSQSRIDRIYMCLEICVQIQFL